MPTNYSISALTEKTTPVGTDYLVIVDSEDTSTPPAGSAGSNKKIKISSLPAGAGGVSGWKNFISDYSADPTGSATSDTAMANAITACIAAQPASFGLIVPPGSYKMASNHDLPYNMVMVGAGSVGGDVTNQYIGSVFHVSSSWSGSTVTTTSDLVITTSYMFGFKDTNIVSGFTGTNGARVSGIFLEGASFTTSQVAGFYLKGPTMCTFDNIRFTAVSGWAIYCDTDSSQNEITPFGQTWFNIQANSCGQGGFYLDGCEDSVFDGVYSIGNNNGPGFYINGCDNSKFVGCNAEWNHTYGFYVTGNWQFYLGGCTFTGCSTDANAQYGMYIDATATLSGSGTTNYGTGPGIIHITGCHFRRDGQNQTSGATASAGLALGATTLPIIVTGCSTIPSIGDSGGSNVQPTNGFYATQAASSYTQPVIITNSLWWGWSHGVNFNGTTTAPTSSSTLVWANNVLAHGPSQFPTYGS